MDVRNEVTIAGREYSLRYRLTDLRAIEQHAAAPGRNLLAMLGGSFEEKLAIVWGGLRHNKGLRTVEDVEELLGKHVEAGGAWDVDVFLVCAETALLSGLAGKPDPNHVARVMGLARRAAGLIDDAEGAGGNAIRAAE